MLVLNQCVLKQSTGGYDPAELFQGGTYKGFWIDASATSTLKQNSNGTTDVAADGDPVGYVAEKSGAGGLMTQATSGQRPLYKVVSGYSCLRFDGSNDFLGGDATVNAMTSSAAAFTFIVTMKPTGGGTYSQHLLRTRAASSQEAFNLYMLSDTSIRLATTSGSRDTTLTADDLKVYTIRHEPSTGNVNIRRNSTVIQSTGISIWGPVNSGTGTVRLSDTDFTNAFNGDIYQALLINYWVSDADVAKAETALGAKAGITL